MKKLFSAILFVIAVSAASAQGSIEITTSKQTFVATETQSVTQFVFKGNATEADELKQKAASMKQRITLEIKKNTEGNYACVLTITTQPHAEYVAKMLMALGFEKVSVDGTEKPVADITEDLKKM